MRHILTKKLFESSTDDAKKIEQVLMNSTEGKDFMALGRWSHRMPRTGNFWLTPNTISGEFLITRDANTDLWKAVLKAPQVYDRQVENPKGGTLFQTIEELLREIWVITVVNSGLMIGKDKLPYEKWLEDPNCPVWNKEMKASEIDTVYLKSTQKDPIVTDLSTVFSSPEWVRKFDLLGMNKSWAEASGVSIGYQSIHSHADHSSIFVDLIKMYGCWQSWGDASFMPNIRVKRAKKKGFKFSMDFNTLNFVVGLGSIEEIENKVIQRVIKFYREYSLDHRAPGEHPLIKCFIAILQGGDAELIVNEIAALVEKEPTMIKKVPAEYRSEVAKKAGFSDSEADAISNASDFGII